MLRRLITKLRGALAVDHGGELYEMLYHYEEMR